ncbi:MAG: hypothetical protein J6V42_03370 [Clostridia bacterium]|nr:hypothetical protein [Clostridia bacterium]
MNNYRKDGDTGTGYLLVKVSTALGAIPIEGALVTVRAQEQKNSDVIYSLKSDRNGLTDKIPLAAPNIKESEAPGGALPYSLYSVDVLRDGYIPLKLSNVAIFDSITSIQPAVLVPLPDNEYTDSFDPKTDISPSDVRGGERN